MPRLQIIKTTTTYNPILLTLCHSRNSMRVWKGLLLGANHSHPPIEPFRTLPKFLYTADRFRRGCNRPAGQLKKCLSENSIPENYAEAVVTDDCENSTTCLFITALFKVAGNKSQCKHRTIEVSSINSKCD